MGQVCTRMRGRVRLCGWIGVEKAQLELLDQLLVASLWGMVHCHSVTSLLEAFWPEQRHMTFISIAQVVRRVHLTRLGRWATLDLIMIMIIGPWAVRILISMLSIRIQMTVSVAGTKEQSPVMLYRCHQIRPGLISTATFRC